MVSAAARLSALGTRAHHPSRAQSTSTFTCFRRLPIEIRVAIWKATMEPRVVEVIYDLPEGFYSEAEYPDALRICHESRDAVLPYYPLCFGTIFHPAKTRFNLDLDTLYIDNSFEEDVPHLFAALEEKERKGLKYVAVDSYFNGSDDDIEPEFVVAMRRAMRSLEGLVELQIVFDIQVLSGRTFGCGQDDHLIELYEKLPTELADPKLGIMGLPDHDEEFDLWKVKKAKAVYGWRRCPTGFDANKPERERRPPWGMTSDRAFWDIMDHGDDEDISDMEELSELEELDSDDLEEPVEEEDLHEEDDDDSDSCDCSYCRTRRRREEELRA